MNESLVFKNSLYLPTHCYQDKKNRTSSDEFVFENDEETCEKIEIPATITSVSDLSNRGNPLCVELTTLSYIPRCKIVKYLGNFNDYL